MGEGKEAQEGGDRCIIMTDSCCCMAETNTMLQSNFPPIKKNFFFLGRCLGPSLCERQGRVGVNSLPPRRTITKSPCRLYQLFVRSIVISLDTKFANVSTLVIGKSTHMQSQDRHFFLLFHSAYSQCWSILYLCREEGFFLLPLATLGPHASQDT